MTWRCEREEKTNPPKLSMLRSHSDLPLVLNILYPSFDDNYNIHLPVQGGLQDGILPVTCKKDYMPLAVIEWTASFRKKAKLNEKLIGKKKTNYRA